MPKDADDLTPFLDACREAGIGVTTESVPCRSLAGFDVAGSGRDQIACVEVRFDKHGRYEFSVEEIELADFDPRVERKFAEQLRRHQERWEDWMVREFRAGGFWTPPRPEVEVITDPGDRRGLDARPARLA